MGDGWGVLGAGLVDAGHLRRGGAAERRRQPSSSIGAEPRRQAVAPQTNWFLAALHGRALAPLFLPWSWPLSPAPPLSPSPLRQLVSSFLASLTYFPQPCSFICIYICIYLLGLQHWWDSSMCRDSPPLSGGMGWGKPRIPIPRFCRVFGGIFLTPNCMPSISAPSGCSRLKTQSCLLQKQMVMPQLLETRPFFITRWQPCMIIASLFFFCFAFCVFWIISCVVG